MKYALRLLLLVLVTNCSLSQSRLSDPAAVSQSQCEIRLPLEDGSTRFAVAGDAGTGGSAQHEIGRQMAACREAFPFDFVLMPGDNLYGSERPSDYRRKFEEPFKALLDADVKFYAVLGNHDQPDQRFYKQFNMGGERYYTFKQGQVRFFGLDSTYMSPEQIEWLEKELKSSNEKWKIAFFHHPLYSSGGRHGPELKLRSVLEPLFVKYGVDAVIAGHEHFYERIKPQHGIYYFTSGAAGKLRKGNVRKSDITAASFDRDRSFMLIEIAGDTLHFQSISRLGASVDHGSLQLIGQKESEVSETLSNTQSK
jgi:predicted phosphodiesterase